MIKESVLSPVRLSKGLLKRQFGGFIKDEEFIQDWYIDDDDRLVLIIYEKVEEINNGVA